VNAAAAESWRSLVATLANETARTVYAEFVTAGASATLSSLSPSRSRRVRDALTGSGLLEVDPGADPDGGLAADGPSLRVAPGVFAAALAAAPSAPRPQGIERFLDADGRIRVYPSDRRKRAELLALVASRAVRPGEVLGEREINARLEAFTDDVAVLRRYLVDHGELERTRSGSEYART
jgi:hypothetical protein